VTRASFCGLTSYMSDPKDYLEYIENVLGVRSVLISPDAMSTEILAIPLLIAVQDYNSYQVEEKELLGKMIAALKIDPKYIQICDLNHIHEYRPEFQITFAEQVGASQTRLVQTLAPRVLLKKPELKKQAWDDLQPVIHFFRSR